MLSSWNLIVYDTCKNTQKEALRSGNMGNNRKQRGNNRNKGILHERKQK